MLDSAEEPLISSQIGIPDEDGTSSIDASDVSQLLEKNLQRPGIFVWLLTFSAAISGLLFGYDTGVISSTLVAIKSSLGHPLTILEKSLITSVTALFALLISPVSGFIADSLGRKRVVLLADLAFIIGALIQAFTPNVKGMIIGRAIIGLGVGAGSFVAPLYITELSPAPFRGRLVILYVLFVTLGQVVAYTVGWLFVEWHNAATSWRWIVGLGAVPAAIQYIIILAMPETPRWLVMKKREDQAKSVLAKVFGSGKVTSRLVSHVLRDIVAEVREEEEAKRHRERNLTTKSEESFLVRMREPWVELFREKANRRALIIACLLQGLQQLSGINSLMYFSATIFTLLGFNSPTLTSLTVAFTNFFMTCIALLLIDRIGRRRILLYSIPAVILGLIFCSIGFHFIFLPNSFAVLPSDLAPSNSTANVTMELALSNSTTEIVNPNFSSTAGFTSSNTSFSDLAPIFILISITIYVGAYAIGLGTVPWLQSELFPLSVRALGSGLSTSTNWGLNFLIGLTFLPMMDFLTPSGTFITYAFFCVFGWLAIWHFYPETMGCSLEEIAELLAER